jgi:hypothetical protein
MSPPWLKSSFVAYASQEILVITLYSTTCTSNNQTGNSTSYFIVVLALAPLKSAVSLPLTLTPVPAALNPFLLLGLSISDI